MCPLISCIGIMPINLEGKLPCQSPKIAFQIRTLPGMSEQPRHDSTPLRRALVIFCAVAFYLGTVFVITVALQSVSEPMRYPDGSKDAADFSARHPLSPRVLIFDHPILEDLEWRSIVVVLLLGGTAVTVNK